MGPEGMTDMDHVTVEPTQALAAHLAVWLLSRDPNVQTVSAGGFLVALDLYADVPSDLLEGAYVDGFLYRHVIDGMVPDGKGYKLADVPVQDGVQPEPVAPKGLTKNGTPRKRRAPATSAPKDDVTVAVAVATETGVSE